MKQPALERIRERIKKLEAEANRFLEIKNNAKDAAIRDEAYKEFFDTDGKLSCFRLCLTLLEKEGHYSTAEVEKIREASFEAGADVGYTAAGIDMEGGKWKEGAIRTYEDFKNANPLK